MFLQVISKFSVGFLLALFITAKSDITFDENVQFIIDYAKYRNIGHVIIYDKYVTKDENLDFYRALSRFSTNYNVFLACVTKDDSLGNVISAYANTAVLIVVMDEKLDTLSETTNIGPNQENQMAWLWLLSRTSTDIQHNNYLDNLLHVTLDFNSDFVIAINIMESNHVIIDLHQDIDRISDKNRNSTLEDIYPSDVPSPDIFLPFSIFPSTSNSLLDYCPNFSNTSYFCLLQLYKIRKHLNASLVIHPLGSWICCNGTYNLKPYQEAEARQFHKFPLVFGMKNLSSSLDFAVSDRAIEDDTDDEQMAEFLTYFTSLLNATEKIVMFLKLGYKDGDQWTDLLGAVIDGQVDVALGSVIKTTEKDADLAFTHNIMKSMRNIYVRPEESREVRNIFLIPFGKRLLLCVLCTGLILTIAVTIASKTAYNNSEGDIENVKIGDAVVWCIAVFSMQGSTWKPTTFAGNLIVIVSLAFALVIYNSYSAFITSVLSVELTKIGSVDDLLESNYDIGYAKNSQDETFLRSMNATHLKQIYLRGYLQNNINTVTEGLLKAARGKYGFFASVQVARKELKNISNFGCVSNIVEIPVQSTINAVAFPMSKASPYRKSINLSIIKMYETGIYKYLHSKILPDIHKCRKSNTTFRSADLPDLSSAFFILIAGNVTGLVLLVCEKCWKRKRQALLGFILKVNKKKNLQEINFSIQPSISSAAEIPFTN